LTLISATQSAPYLISNAVFPRLRRRFAAIPRLAAGGAVRRETPARARPAAEARRGRRDESKAKREGRVRTYGVQRSFFSRGKAWSVDARRPFVSSASRTRNALASHGHRSRLPLTGRPALRLSLSLSLSLVQPLPLPSVHFTRTNSPARYVCTAWTPSHGVARASHLPPLPLATRPPRSSASLLPAFRNGTPQQDETCVPPVHHGKICAPRSRSREEMGGGGMAVETRHTSAARRC